MTSDENLLRNVVHLYMRFEKKMTKEMVVQHLDRKINIMQYFPFCMRIVQNGMFWPYAVRYKGTLLFKDFINEFTLQNKGNVNELQEKINDLTSQPMDISKPMFKISLYHNYVNGGTLMVMSIHHSMADGFSGMKTILHITKLHEEKKENKVIDNNKKTKMKNVEKKKKKKKMGLIEGGFSFCKSLGKILFQSKDNNKQFFAHSGGLGRTQRCHLSILKEPFELYKVKRIANKFNVSLNSIILSFIGSGLRKFLLMKGNDFDKTFEKTISNQFHVFSYNGKIFMTLNGIIKQNDQDYLLQCIIEAYKNHLKLLQ